MVKNLGILALAMTLLLAGVLVYDYYSMARRNLVIFYTSNLRGQMKPFSGVILDRNYERAGGLAFIRGFIEDSSAMLGFNPAHALLVDTGDSLFGTAEASLTMGDVPLELMSKAGYDAMAIGNMEFEFGFERLKYFISSGLVPMLAANYRDVTSSVGNTFNPGIIVEKGGVKIGIVGIGHSDLARNTRQENIINVEISDMSSSVKQIATQLKHEGAEIIVLLSHHPNLGHTENIAQVFPDVDVIIGDFIGPPELYSHTGRPLVCQTAPARGGGVGMVKIPFVGGKWDVTSAHQRLFPIDATTVRPEADLLAEISKVEAKIDNLLDEVITLSDSTLSRSFTTECPVGNLVADSMRLAAETDIALQNSGGIRSSIDKGPVTLRNLYEVLPFENSLVSIELTGWQIENLIEVGLGDDPGFIHASGINCIYSSSNPKGFRIIQVEINGEPINFSKTYSVAVNDFMLSNRATWPELAMSRNQMVKGLVRESFENYLRNHDKIVPSTERRFNDFEMLDETLRVQSLSFQHCFLPEPLSHNQTPDSEYLRLVAEVVRLEAGADFAFIPVGILKSRTEDLQSITATRIISDFNSDEDIFKGEVTGKVLVEIIADSFKSSPPVLAFSGLSLEMRGDDFTVYPWSGNYDDNTIFTIAITESILAKYPQLTQFSGSSFEKVFRDIRRLFLSGLRIRDGQVEIKRALF